MMQLKTSEKIAVNSAAMHDDDAVGEEYMCFMFHVTPRIHTIIQNNTLTECLFLSATRE